MRAGAGSGTTLAALYDSPELVAAAVQQTAAALGDVPERVAASTWQLAYCAYLWSPVLGSTAFGTVPLLDPAQTWWNTAEPVRLSTLAPAESPVTVETVRTAVLDTHLIPLLRTLRSACKVAEPLLWGNIASAAVGAARVMGRDAPWALLSELLEPLGALDGDLRRRSCCLFYRVPGGGYCGDCPLG